MAYISPAVWTPFIQEALEQTQNIISLGLVKVDTASPVSKSGQFLNIPLQSPLDTISNVQRVTTATTLTSTATADVQEIGVVVHEGDSYAMANIAIYERGIDGLMQIAPQLAKVALDGIQTRLYNVTKGILGPSGALADTHVYAPESEVLDVETLTKAPQSIFGENMDKMDTIIINSLKYAELQGLVQYKDAGSFGTDVLYSGMIPTILGKKVVINDTMCASYTDGAVTKYPTFMTKGQPWYLGHQKTLEVFTDFDPKTGGGNHSLTWYQHYVPHLNGVSWTSSTANPTSAELATVGNWTQKQQNYNIGILRINTL